MKYYEDDVFFIPEEYKEMTKEELEAEAAREYAKIMSKPRIIREKPSMNNGIQFNIAINS